MKRRTLAAPSAVALIATIIALNALGAAALPAADEETDARLVQDHDPSDPTSTPAAPMATVRQTIGQRPPGSVVQGVLEPAAAGPPLAEARLQRDDLAQQAKQGTKNLQRAHGPFAVADLGT